MKQNLTIVIFLLFALFAKGQENVFQVPDANVSVLRNFPIGTPSGLGPILNTITANSLYSNVTNFQGTGYAQAGATLSGTNTITALAADDINMATNATYIISSFRFSVANFNTVSVSARPMVRFYLANGTSGGPGTYLASYNFNAIAFTANNTAVYTVNIAAVPFNLTSQHIWAGIFFDNNSGATGATAAQLNLLGQGLFNPVDVGSSQDAFFQTTSAGPFAADNPVGSFQYFGGSPVANFGWEFVSSTPLPITLSIFNGTKYGKTNVLSWTTAQETNSSQILIERSSDASNYKQIGSIAALGNSSTPQTYTYTDASPNEGVNYYRLKLLDKDGKFTYSKIVIISNSTTSIGIYPNPVKDVVNIYLNDNKLLNTKVNMFDGGGKLVKSIQLTDNNQRINVQSLAKGMYVLTFADGTSQKFIKE